MAFPKTPPAIRKHDVVLGHRLRLRNAVVGDAEFILSLRLDPTLNRHLSAISDDLRAQEAWLTAYGRDESQAYFMIETTAGVPVGTVRLYDAVGDSFCWGSWIVKPGSGRYFGLESMAMVYEYGRALGFRQSHFEVRRENERVWQIHERCGARREREDDLNYYYSMSDRSISDFLDKHRAILPLGIVLQ